jgi:hypothetical protein
LHKTVLQTIRAIASNFIFVHHSTIDQTHKKEQKFQWSEECEQSFQELKQRLGTAPVLTFPSGSDEFVIYSDASHKGLGCVLMQQGRVIAYASR